MELLQLWTQLSANSIVLEKSQMKSLERLHDELLYWNEKINLISRSDVDNIWERHIIHSLSIIKYIDIPKKARCLDVGTGGGFPGVPLKIARPDIYMLLLDSVKKKLKIAEMFGKHTGLKNISAKIGRMEEMEKDKQYVAHFDVIFARAVAKIELLIGWSEKLLKPKGQYIFLKGGDLDSEIQIAKNKFPNYDYKLIDISLLGFPSFKEEEKKIVVITRK